MNSQDNDTEIAKQIQAQLGASTDVEQLSVKGHLLQMHVTEGFYNRLVIDRERGRKIVLALMQKMKTFTESQDVTVWIFCKNEKVIEGRVKQWGGDNVQYFYDL